MISVSGKVKIQQRQKLHKGKRLSTHKVKGEKNCKKIKYRKIGIYLQVN